MGKHRGQTTGHITRRPRNVRRDLTAVIFETNLGPIAVVDSPTGLVATFVGHASRQRLETLVRRSFPHAEWGRTSPTAELLRRYAQGQRVEMAAIALDDRQLSRFRQAVTRACRAIPFGRTATYRQLAAMVGRPRASRAVGTVMARNPWPIIVPCHRVIKSDGALGGYSAPRGVELKRRLLSLEARTGRNRRDAAS